MGETAVVERTVEVSGPVCRAAHSPLARAAAAALRHGMAHSIERAEQYKVHRPARRQRAVATTERAA